MSEYSILICYILSSIYGKPLDALIGGFPLQIFDRAFLKHHLINLLHWPLQSCRNIGGGGSVMGGGVFVVILLVVVIFAQRHVTLHCTGLAALN